MKYDEIDILFCNILNIKTLKTYIKMLIKGGVKGFPSMIEFFFLLLL